MLYYSVNLGSNENPKYCAQIHKAILDYDSIQS